MMDTNMLVYFFLILLIFKLLFQINKNYDETDSTTTQNLEETN